MACDQTLKSRNQIGRRAWLDLDNHTRKSRCQGRREIHRRVNHKGNIKAQQGLHQNRTVPIDQVYIQYRRSHNPGRKEGHSLLATRGRTDDFATSVLHGERQV